MNATKQKLTYTEKLCALPEGSMVVWEDGKAYLLYQNGLRQWRAEGYMHAIPLEPARTVQVLTPRSIVKTLAAGYSARVHASAAKISS